MNMHPSAFAAVPLLALALFASAGCASRTPAPAPTAVERTYTPEEEMAAWMAVASPGPEHARMAAESGDWSVAATAWMSPGAPPEKSVGTARMKMILDGRYQVMEYDSTMMGQPFRGMGVTGYDNFTKRYVGSWCDSMGTMMMLSEGGYDAAGKVLTMTSEFLDPLGRKVRSRQVSTRRSDDHMSWEMHCATGAQPESKVLELEFTRKR